jgi:hypothetical protein
MVKTPKTRHSKTRQEPVTIELGPGEVSRVDKQVAEGHRASPETPNPEDGAERAAETPQPEAAGDAAAQETMRAPEADFEPWEHDEAASAAAEHESGEQSGAAEDKKLEMPASETTHHRAYTYGFDEPPAERNPEQHGSGSNADTPAADAMHPPPSEAPPAAAQNHSRLGAVAAGLLGGVIALAGAGALQYAGLLGSPGASASAPNDINDEIADLRGQITALKNAGDGGAGMKIDGLSAALDEVKANVAALQATSPSEGDDDAVAALSGRVDAVEKAIASVGQADTGAPADLGPLNEKLAGLDALVKSAGEASTAQDGRLSALEQSVSQLSAKVDAQASQPRIALAIAASALKAALDRGGPFAAELDTFAAITPDAPQIAALRAYAEKGVPTRAEIAGRMDAVANAMVAADEPVNADAGFFQRLLSSAESLVKVRPIGAVEGKGAPETVARMEAAVNQGDYARALAEYETLPDAVKAAGADFAGKLKARLDVEAQIDALISGAMKA